MLQTKDVFVIRYFHKRYFDQRYYDVKPFAEYYHDSLHFHVDHVVQLKHVQVGHAPSGGFHVLHFDENLVVL